MHDPVWWGRMYRWRKKIECSENIKSIADLWRNKHQCTVKVKAIYSLSDVCEDQYKWKTSLLLTEYTGISRQSKKLSCDGLSYNGWPKSRPMAVSDQVYCWLILLWVTKSSEFMQLKLSINAVWSDLLQWRCPARCKINSVSEGIPKYKS